MENTFGRLAPRRPVLSCHEVYFDVIDPNRIPYNLLCKLGLSSGSLTHFRRNSSSCCINHKYSRLSSFVKSNKAGKSRVVNIHQGIHVFCLMRLFYLCLRLRNILAEHTRKTMVKDFVSNPLPDILLPVTSFLVIPLEPSQPT